MENTVVTDSYVEAEFDINDAIAPADRKPLLKARWLLLAGSILLLIHQIVFGYFGIDLHEKLMYDYYLEPQEASQRLSLIQFISNCLAIILMSFGFFMMSKTRNWQVKIGAITGIIAMIFLSGLFSYLTWLAFNALFPSDSLTIATSYISSTLFSYIFVLCSLGIFLNVRGMDKKAISGLALSYIVIACMVIMVHLANVRNYNVSNVSLLMCSVFMFLQIIFWWKLCSNSYPLEDTEKKPLGAVVFNRLTVGFLAMIPLMILVFYVLMTTILPEINNGYYY